MVGFLASGHRSRFSQGDLSESPVCGTRPSRRATEYSIAGEHTYRSRELSIRARNVRVTLPANHDIAAGSGGLEGFPPEESRQSQRGQPDETDQ